MLRVALAGALLVATPACSRPDDARDGAGPTARPEPARTELAEPCPSSPASFALGSPFRGKDYAEFTAAAGTVFVTARHFEHGGVFDPEVGRTAMYIGPLSHPPSYDRQTGVVSNALVSTDVVEGTWSAVDVPAGRFWLWSTTGGDVIVRSCQPRGLRDAVPAVVAPPGTVPAS